MVWRTGSYIQVLSNLSISRNLLKTKYDEIVVLYSF